MLLCEEVEIIIPVHTDYLLLVASTGVSFVKILCVGLRGFGLFSGFALCFGFVFLKIVKKRKTGKGRLVTNFKS